ncbi:nuA3 HAT complex component nto1 [Rhizoclosmatium sp. JEL0117]|nr:nuA3 HAT complex component nto1 [Rhizoclosmatium sp. JEL0117]
MTRHRSKSPAAPASASVNTSSERHRSSRTAAAGSKLSDFLAADRAFAAALDSVLDSAEMRVDSDSDSNNAKQEEEDEEDAIALNDDTTTTTATVTNQTTPKKKGETATTTTTTTKVPLEERPFSDVAPGIEVLQQLRLIRLHPRLGVLAEHPRPTQPKQLQQQLASKPTLKGLLLSGFDVLLSAIGSASSSSSASSASVAAPSVAPRRRDSLSPRKRKSASPEPPARSNGRSSSKSRAKEEPQLPPQPPSSAEQLVSMFDNEPPPLEFNIPSEFPSFHIQFSKPVPEPHYELIKKSPVSLKTVKPAASSSSSSFGRWARKLVLDQDLDDLDDEVEEETVNGRTVEPTEDELNSRIEYDMDEQDKAWLAYQNAQRHSASSEPPIPDILFEFIMDRLEKEWFDLFKQVPKPRKEMEELEDNNCAVCDDGECENSNAIVFCDGCNLAVHQDCYGVPFIPEGQWLCRRCMVSPDRPVSCCLCPNENGALKQTNSNKWAHVLCAQWIPESGFANTTYMEPIDSRSVPASRYKLTCYLCGRRKGACIQCSQKNCYASYHVTCAKKCKLFMKMGTEDMKSNCDKHAPKEYRDQVDVEKEIFLFRRANNLSNVKFKTTPELEAEMALGLQQELTSEAEQQSPPSKRAKQFHDISEINPVNITTRKRRVIDSDDEGEYGRDGNSSSHPQRAKTQEEIDHDVLRARDEEYKRLIAHPVIPIGICRAVSNAIRGSSNVRGKNAFVEKCCRYWALKREGRRGAPLLKRLHLEPWTATSSVIQQDETVRAKRIEILRKIRNDLERVRMLCELVKKRERERLKRSNTQLQILDLYLNPVTFIVRPILEEIRKLDIKRLFEEPVDLTLVPDYLSVVGKAMCFEDMEEKVEANEYRSVTEFKDDFVLICRNAKLYNKPDTPWYRAADRLLVRAEPILQRAFDEAALLDIDDETGCLARELPRSLFESYDGIPPGPLTVLVPSVPVSIPAPVQSSQPAPSQSSTSTPKPKSEKPKPKPVVAPEKSPLTHSQQLLEDERLAKAIHEQELLESPRSRRRIGDSPSATSMSALSLDKKGVKGTRDVATDEEPVSEPVGDLIQKRRSSLRLGGHQIPDAPESAEVKSALKKKKTSAPTQENVGLSPDAKLRRVIQESTQKASKNTKAATPLAYASIYLAEEPALPPANSSNRRSSSRIVRSAAGVGGGLFGEYPVQEDREFELPKEVKAVAKKRSE